MLNNIIIMGRMVADPEIRTTSTGVMVANFRIACDRDVAAEGSEKKADFFTVVAWRKTAEFVNKYFFKGKPILIQGRLQQRDYVGKDGQKKSVVEILADKIEFCGGEKKAVPAGPTAVAPNGVPTQADLDSIFTEVGGDDKLPFDL